MKKILISDIQANHGMFREMKEIVFISSNEGKVENAKMLLVKENITSLAPACLTSTAQRRDPLPNSSIHYCS